MPISDERITEIARDALKGAVEDAIDPINLTDLLWDETDAEDALDDARKRLEAAIREQARYADGSHVLTADGEAPSVDKRALPESLRGDGPCGDCGTPDNVVWHAENVLWNAVMSFPNPPSHGDPGGIVCIPCFVKRVQVAGLNPVGWTLTADWPWRWTPEGFEAAMAMQEQLLAETAAEATPA